MRKFFFFNIFILLLPVWTIAQLDKYAPTGVRIGADVGNYAYSLIDDQRKVWELTTDIDIYRYLINVDYGYNKFTLNEPTYNYESSGRYLKIGPEVNFIKNQSGDILFFGIKYARTTFEEQLNYQTVNEIVDNVIWPVNTLETTNKSIKGSWFELNAGLKANVFNNVYLGFTVRYKFAPKIGERGTFKPYYLPGYGKDIQGDKDKWGLSYYISYRIPFRKKKKNYFKEAAREKEKEEKVNEEEPSEEQPQR